MAFDFQVAIDCSAPHELADWWAEVLGWDVEEQDEAFIRRMNPSSCGSTSQPRASAHQSASSCGEEQSIAIWTSKAMPGR